MTRFLAGTTDETTTASKFRPAKYGCNARSVSFAVGIRDGFETRPRVENASFVNELLTSMSR